MRFRKGLFIPALPVPGETGPQGPEGPQGLQGTPATVRRASYTLGAFTVLASTLEQIVVWSTPMPDTNYTIIPTISASLPSLAGTVAAELKPGTKTTNGCTIMCNSLGVALDAGQTLYITAIA